MAQKRLLLHFVMALATFGPALTASGPALTTSDPGRFTPTLAISFPMVSNLYMPKISKNVLAEYMYAALTGYVYATI